MPYVFSYGSKQIRCIRRALDTACQRVGIVGVVFQELRHTLVTNMRQAGVDYLRTMAITGHQTMDVFERYHTIAQDDLRHAVRQEATSMDATPASPTETIHN